MLKKFFIHIKNACSYYRNSSSARAVQVFYNIIKIATIIMSAFLIRNAAVSNIEMNISYALFGLGIVSLFDALKIVYPKQSISKTQMFDILNALCSMLIKESQEDIKKVIYRLKEVLLDKDSKKNRENGSLANLVSERLTKQITPEILV